MSVEKLLTVGEIANRLGCPIHKVLYLINSRQIKPSQRAGALRIFNEETIETIRMELGTDRRRHFIINKPESASIAAAAV